jgi:hypothetical protein
MGKATSVSRRSLSAQRATLNVQKGASIMGSLMKLLMESLVGRQGPLCSRYAITALSLYGPALALYWPRVAEASIGPSPLYYPPPPGGVSSPVIFP